MSVRDTSDLHLSSAAAKRVRREIRRARGNEVCFLAAVGEAGAVDELRVLARGHASAVLAAVKNPPRGGLLIHNHPSGVLEPSEADLQIAAQLWEDGVGFAITDNDASELACNKQRHFVPGNRFVFNCLSQDSSVPRAG